MAFQAYVDQILHGIDGHHLTAAAILGHDGAVWAQSSNFPQVKSEEISAVMKNFDEPGYLIPIGLKLGGTKYFVIEGYSGTVLQTKKELGGVIIRKTNLSIVLGIFDSPTTMEQCSQVVNRLGDYLVEQSY